MTRIDATTHNGCTIGNKHLLWQRVIADYRCDACSGRLVRKVDYDARIYWAECYDCKARNDVIHRRQLDAQRLDAVEVAGSLPAGLQETIGFEMPSDFLFEPCDLAEARRLLSEGGYSNAGDVRVQIRLAASIAIAREVNGTGSKEIDLVLR